MDEVNHENIAPEETRDSSDEIRVYSLQITKARGSEETWLHVQGDVLVYVEETKHGVFRYFAPVENVKALPPGRVPVFPSFKQLVLKWIPLFFITTTAFLFTLFPFLDMPEVGMLFVPLLGAASLVGTICLFIHTWWSGVPTTRLLLGPEGFVVEFIRKPGFDNQTYLFLGLITMMQNSIISPPTTRATMAFVSHRRTPFEQWKLETMILFAIVSGAIFPFWLGLYGDRIFYWYHLLPYILLLIPLIKYLLKRRRLKLHLPAFLEAYDCYRRGEMEKTEEILVSVLQKYPSYIGAWDILIDVYLSQQRYDEAYETYNAMRAFGVISPKEASDGHEHVMSWKTIDERLGFLQKEPEAVESKDAGEKSN
jgi:pentatricopeptide repeat protein